MKIKTK